MSKRKVHLTAQIKPATRNALMDQMALAAEEIIELRVALEARDSVAELMKTRAPWEPMWHRFAWWRK